MFFHIAMLEFSRKSMRYVNNVGSHRQDNLLGRSQRYDRDFETGRSDPRFLNRRPTSALEIAEPLSGRFRAAATSHNLRHRGGPSEDEDVFTSVVPPGVLGAGRIVVCANARCGGRANLILGNKGRPEGCLQKARGRGKPHQLRPDGRLADIQRFSARGAS